MTDAPGVMVQTFCSSTVPLIRYFPSFMILMNGAVSPFASISFSFISFTVPACLLITAESSSCSLYFAISTLLASRSRLLCELAVWSDWISELKSNLSSSSVALASSSCRVAILLLLLSISF